MKSKTGLNTVGNYRQSAAAGALIGFGVVINSMMINPIVGAVLFSLGLLSIIKLSLPLYTGRIGFYQDKTLVGIFIGNLIGVVTITYLYLCMNPAIHYMLYDSASVKFSKGFHEMFCAGVLCGMLIHFAVKIKTMPVVVMAVAVFILTGTEHCIADFPYLVAQPTFDNLIKWLLVILGNSIGAICIEIFTVRNDTNEICSDNSK